MKVMVVGGSGFIGRPLVEALLARGDEVVVTGRSEARLRKTFRQGVACAAWDPTSGPLPDDVLAGVEGVVNLAGESVAKGRWTGAKKTRIRDSRVIGTRNLVHALQASHVKTFVSASAIGYYGDTKHNAVHEHQLPGDDFLAGVCRAWEAEAAVARVAGIRTAIVRVGIVLGKGGGAYGLMTRPFRLFVGGKIGLGRAWLSWIHLDDIVGIFLHCLDCAQADDVYNGTAPHPVSNTEFTETVASVLKRPALFPVPPQMLRIVLGEFAHVVTGSCRAKPLRTIGLGYEFRYPKLRTAIENLEKGPAR